MKRVLFFIFLHCLAVSPVSAQKPVKAPHSGKLVEGKVSEDAVGKAGMDLGAAGLCFYAKIELKSEIPA